MNKLLSKRFQTGASQLVLVLVVATILSLITISIQIVAFLLTKTAAQSTFTQTAYFAAEGALFETISHLENDINWPPVLPYEDEYEINDTTITRFLELDSETGLIIININADAKGAKRKLIGTYAPGSDGGSQLDVMLVIDKSGSMNSWNVGNTQNQRAIDFAKTSANSFVTNLRDRFSTAKVGVLTYDHTVKDFSDPSNQELTSLRDDAGYNQLLTTIDSIDANTGGTNIAQALSVARTHLDEQGRDNANKIIILLSDGVPQFASETASCNSLRITWDYDAGVYDTKEPYQANGCYPDACFADAPESYSPDSGGNCCTQDAVTIAEDLKYGISPTNSQQRDYLIFSIFLNSYQRNLFSGDVVFSACNDASRTSELGAKTMMDISSEPDGTSLPPIQNSLTYFKETSDLTQLEGIYQELAETIAEPGFFQYIEDEPDPNEEE